MLIIDASNIAVHGGGHVLLKRLLMTVSVESPTIAIVGGEFSTESASNGLNIVRKQFPVYGNQRDRFLRGVAADYPESTLLCFGNVPPAGKLRNTRTITYFHNLHLVRDVDFGRYGWKDHLRYFALSKLIWLRKRNTDRWVVQTDYVKRVFCDFFGVAPRLVDVFPFYNAPFCVHDKNPTVLRTQRFVYASSGAIHKNHLILFDAWEMLHREHQLRPELVVTIEPSRKKLIRLMDRLNASGVNITNLGQRSNEEILNVLKSSTYVIFPSYLETLGLGMVEGAINGCVVLCGDFPFVKDILKNPIQFNAFSAESIAETVANTLRVAPSQPTIVNLEDMTTQFVKYLTDY